MLKITISRLLRLLFKWRFHIKLQNQLETQHYNCTFINKVIFLFTIRYNALNLDVAYFEKI